MNKFTPLYANIIDEHIPSVILTKKSKKKYNLKQIKQYCS